MVAVAALVAAFAEDGVGRAGHDGLVGAGIGAGTALDARIGDGKPWRLESRTAPGEALAEDLVVAPC